MHGSLCALACVVCMFDLILLGLVLPGHVWFLLVVVFGSFFGLLLVDILV